MDVHAKGHAVGKCRGTISDLSVGGMSFKTTAELEEGASLYLKINIPLKIRGEVRHMKSGSVGGMHRYGVRFHKLGFETADKEGRPLHRRAIREKKPGRACDLRSYLLT